MGKVASVATWCFSFLKIIRLIYPPRRLLPWPAGVWALKQTWQRESGERVFEANVAGGAGREGFLGRRGWGSRERGLVYLMLFGSCSLFLPAPPSKRHSQAYPSSILASRLVSPPRLPATPAHSRLFKIQKIQNSCVIVR